MAISWNLIGSKGLAKMPGGLQPFMEMPPNRVVVGAAAGRTQFLAGSNLFSFKNTGDAVWVLVQLFAGAVNAGSDMGTGSGLSIPLATGDGLDFALPDDVDPALWCLDVRAYP